MLACLLAGLLAGCSLADLLARRFVGFGFPLNIDQKKEGVSCFHDRWEVLGNAWVDGGSYSEGIFANWMTRDPELRDVPILYSRPTDCVHQATPKVVVWIGCLEFEASV